MGAAREMYPDEKQAQSVLLSASNLQMLVWLSHGYTETGHWKQEVLESIDSIKAQLTTLAEQVNKEEK